jgi:hypothetical protein
MTKQLINSRTRVLAGALALHRFTVAELAAFTGVKPVSVKTVLGRDAGYFNVVGKVMTGRKGGQPDQYSLKAGSRRLLETELASLRGETADIVAPSAQERQEHALGETSHEDLRFLTASNAAREAILQINRAQDPTKREALVAQNRSRMAGLQGVLQLAKNSASYEAFKNSWQELRSQWQKTLSSLQTHQGSDLPADNVLSSVHQRAADVLDWLRSWVVPAPCSTAFAVYDGYEGIAALLARDSGLPSPLGLLAPAASIAVGKAHWSPRERDALHQDIVDHLSDPRVLDSPQRFSALLACAAMADAQSALKPIQEVTARADFDERLIDHERMIALLSIARLAHPWLPRAGDAALVSYMLLHRTGCYERDAQYLLPAAVRDANVNAYRLLDRFAQAVYGTRGLLSDEEERSFMLNLAMAFGSDNLHRLARAVPDLLSTTHGNKFFAALVNTRHEAVRLRGHDELNFVLSPGFSLLQTGRVNASEEPVKVEPLSNQGKALNHLIWLNSETNQTGADRPRVRHLDINDAESELLNFYRDLKGARQADLRGI